MEAVFRFLGSYEVLIYLLLAIGAMFTLRWLLQSWSEWREAIYGLEREFAQRRVAQSLAVLLLIIGLAFGELIVASFVIPSMPASVFLPTATLSLLLTPTGTISPEMATSLALTPVVASPQGQSVNGCLPGQLEITSPETGSEVSGIVTVVGTVDVPDFGFYKYEVAPQGTENWTTISAGREVIHDGDLAAWDTTEWSPGDYLLRLVAFDNRNQSYPPCIIPVRIKGQ
jgi:hypothetical protein